jgi:hypothetical protein
MNVLSHVLEVCFLGLINIAYSFMLTRQHMPLGDCKNTCIQLGALQGRYKCKYSVRASEFDNQILIAVCSSEGE